MATYGTLDGNRTSVRALVGKSAFVPLPDSARPVGFSDALWAQVQANYQAQWQAAHQEVVGAVQNETAQQQQQQAATSAAIDNAKRKAAMNKALWIAGGLVVVGFTVWAFVRIINRH